MTRANDI